ncbi:MAG: GTPase [Hyphomonadaceae bacterium]
MASPSDRGGGPHRSRDRFPDEDLPGALAQQAGPILQSLADDMGHHLDDAHRGERIRDGFRIAIIGPPNAGKSSLLNALAQREAAIVSDIPGTTRDVVEVRLVLAGFPVWIADTAGLREAADAIEAEGVRRALARAEEADLRIGVVEAGADVAAAESLLPALRSGDALVFSKLDLVHELDGAPATDPGIEFSSVLVSTVGGSGLDELRDLLVSRVADALGREEAPVLTRARHRRLVEEARAALSRAIPALDVGPELAAEDVRVAADQIGRLTGRIDVEDLLGEIFSSFCIGK